MRTVFICNRCNIPEKIWQPCEIHMDERPDMDPKACPFGGISQWMEVLGAEDEKKLEARQ